MCTDLANSQWLLAMPLPRTEQDFGGSGHFGEVINSFEKALLPGAHFSTL